MNWKQFPYFVMTENNNKGKKASDFPEFIFKEYNSTRMTELANRKPKSGAELDDSTQNGFT